MNFTSVREAVRTLLSTSTCGGNTPRGLCKPTLRGAGVKGYHVISGATLTHKKTLVSLLYFSGLVSENFPIETIKSLTAKHSAASPLQAPFQGATCIVYRLQFAHQDPSSDCKLQALHNGGKLCRTEYPTSQKTRNFYLSSFVQ